MRTAVVASVVFGIGILTVISCISDDQSVTRTTAVPDAGVASLTCDPQTEKACGGLCVRKDDPTYGCKDEACGPCSDANFVDQFKCANQRCEIDTCFAGRDDCNGNALDGCEADVTRATQCGNCATQCPTSAAFCVGSDAGTFGCTSACNLPQKECVSAAGKACSDLSTDVNNCNTCNTVCPTPFNGSRACVAGVCKASCLPGMKLEGSAACIADHATCLGTNASVRNTLQCCAGGIASKIRGVYTCNVCLAKGTGCIVTQANTCCAGLVCKPNDLTSKAGRCQ
jgi:hypothetical protein